MQGRLFRRRDARNLSLTYSACSVSEKQIIPRSENGCESMHDVMRSGCTWRRLFKLFLLLVRCRGRGGLSAGGPHGVDGNDSAHRLAPASLILHRLCMCKTHPLQIRHILPGVGRALQARKLLAAIPWMTTATAFRSHCLVCQVAKDNGMSGSHGNTPNIYHMCSCSVKGRTATSP